MQCCRDVSPFIRKLSVDSLSQIYSKSPEFYQEYIEGIFPLTADNEASVQEKALGSVKDVVFDAITSKKREGLGWQVLSNLGETLQHFIPFHFSQGGVIPRQTQSLSSVAILRTSYGSLGSYDSFLPEICEKFCRNDAKYKLTPREIRAIKDALESPNASTAWKVLCYLSEHTQIMISIEHIEASKL